MQILQSQKGYACSWQQKIDNDLATQQRNPYGKINRPPPNHTDQRRHAHDAAAQSRGLYCTRELCIVVAVPYRNDAGEEGGGISTST